MPAPRKAGNANDVSAANEDKESKKNTSTGLEGLMMKILLAVIIVLLLSLPVLIIKFDVRGLGQKMRPLLEDLPYVQKILPAKPDPNDPKFMNKEELTTNYLTYKDKYEQLSLEVNSLRNELDMLSNIKNNYQQFQDDQNKAEEAQRALLQEKQQLETDRKKFFDDIADAKKTDFKAYFELIDKETAQKLYEEILQAEKADQETKEYVSFYENMDAENAAKIFDEMVASKMDLIVKIFKYMNKEQAAEILASMDTGNAAKVSDILSKEYPIGLPKD